VHQVAPPFVEQLAQRHRAELLVSRDAVEIGVGDRGQERQAIAALVRQALCERGRIRRGGDWRGLDVRVVARQLGATVLHRADPRREYERFGVGGVTEALEG
jgi:hypothetical protein